MTDLTHLPTVIGELNSDQFFTNLPTYNLAIQSFFDHYFWSVNKACAVPIFIKQFTIVNYDLGVVPIQLNFKSYDSRVVIYNFRVF